MIKPLFTALAVLALATPAAGQVPVPPQGMVWYVLNDLNAFYFDVEDPTNRPPLTTEVPEGVLVPVEINHDGKTDWLIVWPESAQYCGTGGCQRTLYISGEGGFTRAFDRQALDLTLGTVEGEVRIEAWVHHLSCDDRRAECRFAWAWDEETRQLVERPSSDGATLLDSGPLDVIDRGQDANGTPLPAPDLPGVLSALWESARIVCPSEWTESGVEIRRTEIVALPDLTGDGLREWQTQEPAACDAEALEPAKVWTSQRNGDPILSWTAQAGEYLAIDLVSPPQLVATATPCDDQGRCATRRLVWQAAQRSFVQVGTSLQ